MILPINISAYFMKSCTLIVSLHIWSISADIGKTFGVNYMASELY